MQRNRQKSLDWISYEIERLMPKLKDDFLFQESQGYSKENCAGQVKRELLARQLLDCSFNPSSSALTSGSLKRCSPAQSASYYRSFIDTNNTQIQRVKVVNIADQSGLQTRYDKECIQDCIQDRSVFQHRFRTKAREFVLIGRANLQARQFLCILSIFLYF